MLSNILFVDDERDTCTLMCEAITYEGFRCDTLYDYTSAIEACHKYEILVTDYNLGPGPNGLDLAKHFKSVRSNGYVILITGTDDVISAEINLKIMKPMNLKFFADALHKAEAMIDSKS